MSAKTCDYAGNGGFLEARTNFQINDRKKRGAVPFLANGYTQNTVTLAGFRDGTSNTLLLWESAGLKWYSHQNGSFTEGSWEDWHALYGEVKLVLNENEDINARCTARNTLGYMYGWAGVNRCRLRVWDEEGIRWGSHLDSPSQFGRVVNVTNSHRSPFSFHSTICNVVNADGSVHTVNEGIEPSVFIALTTRWGGEVASLP